MNDKLDDTIAKPAANFIRHIIAEDQASGKHSGRVATRFPPEPNGYLHLGHAKSICLNFGLASENNGACNLRFDDTNPGTEDIEYVNSIQADVKWLGFDWQDRLFHASDYFEKIHDHAVGLIKASKAYVCSLNSDQIREYRGTLTRPGKDSPDRSRSVEENLDLFRRMRAGEFADGQYVLRAKIDMNSPNINMRDPTLYRIRKMHHWRKGDTWCIYPMYDYAHPLSDAYEKITHSICTLEFEDHRPFYDWVLENCGYNTSDRPQQIEMSRLNLTYTVLSKRKLLELVEEKLVNGWDDPRMPTISGVRRRGFTPAAMRDFCERIGVTKKESVIDVGTLENCVREDLNKTAPRAMAVLNPLKVVIENFPEGTSEDLEAPVHPQDPSQGTRKIPFSKEIYIEQDDFMEDPPKKFFRLGPGREVRLRYAYVIKCEKVIKDSTGKVCELRCTYDVATRSGSTSDTRKVKGVIHWVPIKESLKAEVRLYDRLFNVENPNRVEENQDFKAYLNPKSLSVSTAYLEPSMASAKAGARYQFERLGYFCADAIDSKAGALVFNRTVPLRDTWAKESGSGE